MALKAKKIEGNKEEKIIKLIDEISGINKQIFDLQVEREEKKNTILAIKLAPYKIGDYVVAEVPSGRGTRKSQKCLLECEDGTLYLRPVKADGNLSGRRFSLIPVGGKSYSDYFKEVKE